MNYESQADKNREFQDAQAIDASYSERPFSNLIDTPAVKAAFEKDESFHKNMKAQAAAKGRARKLAERAATVDADQAKTERECRRYYEILGQKYPF